MVSLMDAEVRASRFKDYLKEFRQLSVYKYLFVFVWDCWSVPGVGAPSVPVSDMRIEIDFEMDAEGVRRGGEALLGLAMGAGDVVIDLGAVRRFDSSGIGLLVHLQKRKLEGNWQFAVTNAQGQPRELLDELRLLSVWADRRPDVRTAPGGEVEAVWQS
jgi:anti-anti-sigma regulatory factor